MRTLFNRVRYSVNEELNQSYADEVGNGNGGALHGPPQVMLLPSLLQHLPELFSQGVQGKGFLEEVHSLLQNAVVGNDVGRVSGDE